MAILCVLLLKRNAVRVKWNIIPLSLCLLQWWFVDLGQTTDVLGMTLWQRSDCCQGRLVGLQFFIGNSRTSFASNTLCPNVNTPFPTAPWFYNISCQLSGRYVWVVSPQVHGPAGEYFWTALRPGLCKLMFLPDFFCRSELLRARGLGCESLSNTILS